MKCVEDGLHFVLSHPLEHLLYLQVISMKSSGSDSVLLILIEASLPNPWVIFPDSREMAFIVSVLSQSTLLLPWVVFAKCSSNVLLWVPALFISLTHVSSLQRLRGQISSSWSLLKTPSLMLWSSPQNPGKGVRLCSCVFIYVILPYPTVISAKIQVHIAAPWSLLTALRFMHETSVRNPEGQILLYSTNDFNCAHF